MKKLLLILFILSIVLSAYYRPYYDDTTKTVTFTIEKKGWYIIPMDYDYSDCNNKLYSKSLWIWSPTAKKYIGGHFNTEMPEEDNNLLKQDGSDGYLYANPSLGGAWMYFSGPCEIEGRVSIEEFEEEELDEELNEIKLAKGWNFFIVISPYSGYSLDDIKGDCDIEKIIYWDANTQDFVNVEIDEIINDKMSLLDSGIHMLLDVSEECNLGLNNRIISPPALPGG